MQAAWGRYEAGAEAGLLSNGREATPDYRRSKRLYQEAASVYPAGKLPCCRMSRAPARKHHHGVYCQMTWLLHIRSQALPPCQAHTFV